MNARSVLESGPVKSSPGAVKVRAGTGAGTLGAMLEPAEIFATRAVSDAGLAAP